MTDRINDQIMNLNMARQIELVTGSLATFNEEMAAMIRQSTESMRNLSSDTGSETGSTPVLANAVSFVSSNNISFGTEPSFDLGLGLGNDFASSGLGIEGPLVGGRPQVPTGFTVTNGKSEELLVSDDDSNFDIDLPFATNIPQDTGAPQVLAEDTTIDGTTYAAGTSVYTTGPFTLTDEATGQTYTAVGIGIGEQSLSIGLRGEDTNLVGYAFVGDLPPPGVELSFPDTLVEIDETPIRYDALAGAYPTPLTFQFGDTSFTVSGVDFSDAELAKLEGVDWNEAFTTNIFFDPNGNNGILDNLGLFHWLGGDAELTNKVLDVTFSDGADTFTLRDFIEGGRTTPLSSAADAGLLAQDLLAAIDPNRFTATTPVQTPGTDGPAPVDEPEIFPTNRRGLLDGEVEGGDVEAVARDSSDERVAVLTAAIAENFGANLPGLSATDVFNILLNTHTGDTLVITGDQWAEFFIDNPDFSGDLDFSAFPSVDPQIAQRAFTDASEVFGQLQNHYQARSHTDENHRNFRSVFEEGFTTDPAQTAESFFQSVKTDAVGNRNTEFRATPSGDATEITKWQDFTTTGFVNIDNIQNGTIDNDDIVNHSLVKSILWVGREVIEELPPEANWTGPSAADFDSDTFVEDHKVFTVHYVQNGQTVHASVNEAELRDLLDDPSVTFPIEDNITSRVDFLATPTTTLSSLSYLDHATGEFKTLVDLEEYTDLSTLTNVNEVQEYLDMAADGSITIVGLQVQDHSSVKVYWANAALNAYEQTRTPIYDTEGNIESGENVTTRLGHAFGVYHDHYSVALNEPENFAKYGFRLFHPFAKLDGIDEHPFLDPEGLSEPSTRTDEEAVSFLFDTTGAERPQTGSGLDAVLGQFKGATDTAFVTARYGEHHNWVGLTGELHDITVIEQLTDTALTDRGRSTSANDALADEQHQEVYSERVGEYILLGINVVSIAFPLAKVANGLRALSTTIGAELTGELASYLVPRLPQLTAATTREEVRTLLADFFAAADEIGGAEKEQVIQSVLGLAGGLRTAALPVVLRATDLDGQIFANTTTPDATTGLTVADRFDAINLAQSIYPYNVGGASAQGAADTLIEHWEQGVSNAVLNEALDHLPDVFASEIEGIIVEHFEGFSVTGDTGLATSRVDELDYYDSEVSEEVEIEPGVWVAAPTPNVGSENAIVVYAEGDSDFEAGYYNVGSFLVDGETEYFLIDDKGSILEDYSVDLPTDDVATGAWQVTSHSERRGLVRNFFPALRRAFQRRAVRLVPIPGFATPTTTTGRFVGFAAGQNQNLWNDRFIGSRPITTNIATEALNNGQALPTLPGFGPGAENIETVESLAFLLGLTTDETTPVVTAALEPLVTNEAFLVDEFNNFLNGGLFDTDILINGNPDVVHINGIRSALSRRISDDVFITQGLITVDQRDILLEDVEEVVALFEEGKFDEGFVLAAKLIVEVNKLKLADTHLRRNRGSTPEEALAVANEILAPYETLTDEELVAVSLYAGLDLGSYTGPNTSGNNWFFTAMNDTLRGGTAKDKVALAPYATILHRALEKISGFTGNVVNSLNPLTNNGYGEPLSVFDGQPPNDPDIGYVNPLTRGVHVDDPALLDYYSNLDAGDLWTSDHAFTSSAGGPTPVGHWKDGNVIIHIRTDKGALIAPITFPNQAFREILLSPGYTLTLAEEPTYNDQGQLVIVLTTGENALAGAEVPELPPEEGSVPATITDGFVTASLSALLQKLLANNTKNLRYRSEIKNAAATGDVGKILEFLGNNLDDQDILDWAASPEGQEVLNFINEQVDLTPHQQTVLNEVIEAGFDNIPPATLPPAPIPAPVEPPVDQSSSLIGETPNEWLYYFVAGNAQFFPPLADFLPGPANGGQNTPAFVTPGLMLNNLVAAAQADPQFAMVFNGWLAGFNPQEQQQLLQGVQGNIDPGINANQAAIGYVQNVFNGNHVGGPGGNVPPVFPLPGSP